MSLAWALIATMIGMGIVIGMGLREFILVFRHGWSYEEKLRIYNKERLHK